MRTTFISTASLLGAPRTGIVRMQADMAQLSKEVSTGRMADVGLNLGAETGRAASLHIDTAAISALIDSNGAAVQRLQQTQTALTKLTDGANTFMQQLIAQRDSATSVDGIAASALAGFVADANASDGKSYLFSGINSAIKPVADYSGAPKAAVDAAFLAKFGVAPGDPAAANISATAISDFLDNEFANLFADPDWGTTWSSASDTPARSRVAPGESIDTSVSANQPAMRKLAMAYAMVAGLGTDSLGADARKAVIDKAISVLGTAVSGLTDLGQAMGSAENRVTAATTRLTAQQDILATRISTLEGVDPADAKVKIDTLSTQIEMSYSLTVKLLNMSLLNYVT